MKVLTVVDKQGSAIERLAQGVKKYNPHHEIDILAVHPKRPNPGSLEAFKLLAKEADIIDFQYWQTALMLLDEYPEILKDKRKILQHHNPYSIKESDWNQFDLIVTNNKTIQDDLFNNYGKPSEPIYNTIDIQTFDYKQEYNWNKVVGMVAGRIEGKKGILEVAKICKSLGYKFLLVGRISDSGYFQQIVSEVGHTLDFRENVSEEELRKAYHEMGCLVVNSVPNFESGPLPPLEAIASGIPVVSNMVGMMTDILKDNNNSIIHNRKNLDVILASIGQRDLNAIRSNAWEMVKRFDDRRRAREYSKLYYGLHSYSPLVSVIVPTADRTDSLISVLASIDAQSYDNIEIVIADDGKKEKIEKYIPALRKKLTCPIKYVSLGGEGYQLAKARNLAAIEAEGDYLMFVDDRLAPERNAVQNFVSMMDGYKEWLFGNKGASKRNFVENFSFVRRKEFIEAGMFCESITKYGGLTEETRIRFKRQGFNFRYISGAKCVVTRGTHKNTQRRRDIIDSKFTLFKMYK